MLARRGYGVLALDNPGNGESEGRNNGLGDNAQPGITAAVDCKVLTSTAITSTTYSPGAGNIW